MNAILERQIHAARLLAAQDPPKRTGRGRDPRTGREFTFAPASEYMRLMREVLPRAGLILRPVVAKITPEGLERTYRLTHDPTQTGASEEWTTVTPLDRSVPPDLAAVWARTHSLVAVVKDLLLPDEEDVPDPSERAPSRPETLEDRDAQTERVHAAREERRRATRPTRATRAANSLAGHLTGGAAPVVELGQAEQEHEEQRAAEAERAADERAAASPSAPVADPDWLDEEREQVKHLLEDRLRVELERTRDQIQVDADRLSSETSTAGPDAVSEPAPPPADEATDEELGAEGEVCGLCVPTEGRCAECDVPLAADSTVCPDPECPSNERQGTPAEALEALVGDDEGGDEPEGWCGRVGPDRVVCSTCGNRKNPVGRSVAPEMHGCDWECPGYWEAPRPDQLWPGERCAPPLCTHTGPLTEPTPEQVQVVGQVAERVQEALSPRHGNPERRARGAKWAARPRRRAKAHNVGACSECGRRIDPGDDYHKGVAPDPKDPGRRLSKRGQPVGVACVACVQTLEQDPRAQEETTS